ncbi:rod shape-determining protein RodA [Govanella unica]|uniref:Peptidoglycan glycosyltransferase MrdB n=1 Tax=Govanella unica TaxID=2975056 RepID=A0A9X3TY27_9PROT|nr:rod shape-determining protein RodA [Govania unica]MDA5193477.1 rod shape-determining protein RodA [Govania unica]
MPDVAVELKGQDRSWHAKIRDLNWIIIGLITVIATYGFAVLFSVAGGHLDPWADRQIMRFVIGTVIMIAIAIVNLRYWMAIAYPLYFVTLLLLVAVEIAGEIGMGAQRWLDIGPIRLQPSEIMKIALVLVLARYYHGLTTSDAARVKSLFIPLALIFVPVALVMKQPDLGTAMLLTATGAAVMFLAGVRMWIFLSAIGSAVACVPIAWRFLRDYQKDRILTFLDPERDPLGSGYHIMQSKIALGSGGTFGKGFMLGTQAQLNFLPEKQTDFIFTMLSEELGLVGALALLLLYVALIGYSMLAALSIKSHFGRLLASGIIFTFFLYVFINMAMVMGLVPVVGVPLPLISYGGSAMLTLLVGFGLVLSAVLHRNTIIPRGGPFA